MNKLDFKLLINKLFPKLYPVEETLEEISVKKRYPVQDRKDIPAPYIKWRVYREESDIEIKVEHTFTHKGTVIGRRIETVTVPYLFAHAEPIEIAPTGDVPIKVSELQSLPVFKWRDTMYDMTKIGFSDYSSMVIAKGKVLERAKNFSDIAKEYADWIKNLEESSTDIMANARW